MNRKTHEVHMLEGQKLPIIFHYDIAQRRTSPIANWHANVEILYFTLGSGQVLCNSVAYPVKEGDVFVINSNQLHCVLTDTECEYFCLIVDSDFLSSNELYVEKIEFDTIVRSAKAEEHYRNLVRAIHSDEAYRIASIRAHVLQLMLYLARNHSAAVSDERHREDTDKNIKQAIGYIKSNLDQHLTLEILAAEANLSKYYFAREFKKATGATVVAYINATRCSYAQKLLLSQQYSIHEVASMCGFENDSYFSKTYKNIMGCLPSETAKKRF